MNAQVEDRICRIGQERACMIFDMVAEHKIDKIIHDIVAKKAQVLADSGLGV